MICWIHDLRIFKTLVHPKVLKQARKTACMFFFFRFLKERLLNIFFWDSTSQIVDKKEKKDHKILILKDKQIDDIRRHCKQQSKLQSYCSLMCYILFEKSCYINLINLLLLVQKADSYFIKLVRV